jgi:hypothetical protein
VSFPFDDAGSEKEVLENYPIPQNAARITIPAHSIRSRRPVSTASSIYSGNGDQESRIHTVGCYADRPDQIRLGVDSRVRA